MNRDRIVIENGVYYRKVVPDGGWGYAVCVMFVLVSFIIMWPHASFGLIFKEFLDVKNPPTKIIGLHNGITTLTIACFGFLTSMLLRLLSPRQVGFIGSSLYVIGSFCGIFMSSIAAMILTYGFIMTMGEGLILCSSMVAFNMYFEKKRYFVMSVCQVLLGVLFIMAPLLANIVLHYYNFRGALIVVCGVGFISFFAFALVQPVENHYKLEEIDSEVLPEIKELLRDNNYSETTKSIGPEDNASDKKSFSTKVGDFLGLNVCKNPVVLNISLGTAIYLNVDLLVLTFLPLHLYMRSLTQGEVTFVLSVSAIGDLFGRVTLAVLSKIIPINARKIFLLDVAIIFLLIIVLPYAYDKLFLYAIIGVYGFFRGGIMCLNPILLSEYVPVEKFAAASGISMLFVGVMSVILGPIVGAIKDITGDYVMVFNMLAAILLLCIVPWTIELFIVNRRRDGAH